MLCSQASTTLDAGVKIYSFRVDSVHTETFKLMAGLNRSSAKVEDTVERDEENEEGEKEKVKKTKKFAHGKCGLSFLERNPEALNLKKMETGFEVRVAGPCPSHCSPPIPLHPTVHAGGSSLSAHFRKV